ncbi:MAG: hypothetical protein ACO3NL_00015 [Phycisphaerales bacterium]
MFSVQVAADVGGIEVQTTSHRGMTPEEVAKNAINKIISISDSTDPVLKIQAEAFRERMFHVIVSAIIQGIKSDRTTLYNLLKNQGHDDMAEILRTL